MMTNHEIKKLLKQCTPGPWIAKDETIQGPPLVRINKKDGLPAKHPFNGTPVSIISDNSTKANSIKQERIANAAIIVEAVRRLREQMGMTDG